MSGAEPASREALLSHFRHELRTPLNAILGYSEMLLEDGFDPNVDAILSHLHSDGARLLTSLNAILDLEALDVQDSGWNMEAFQQAVRAGTSGLMKRIIDAAAQLLEIVPAEQARVRSDIDKIRSAGLHFLEIVDTVDAGQGAPPAASPGAAPLAPADAPASASADPAQGPRGHLLVVDDSEINRDLLTRHLQRHGFTTSVADNGHTALTMLQRQSFDLVLLDVMMPELDGYAVLQRLKSSPSLRDIPVLVVSALEDLASVVRCIELGADDYLPKPFNPTLLRARIDAGLAKKRLRDQELAYLHSVETVISAALAVEAGSFDPASLAEASARPDALGQLSRVFSRMASEVQARERRLQAEVQQLRIEIDQSKAARDVAAITETDYFHELQRQVKEIRKRKG